MILYKITKMLFTLVTKQKWLSISINSFFSQLNENIIVQGFQKLFSAAFSPGLHWVKNQETLKICLLGGYIKNKLFDCACPATQWSRIDKYMFTSSTMWNIQQKLSLKSKEEYVESLDAVKRSLHESY